MIDSKSAGYRLEDDRQLVGQSRLLWVFSHAHARGFRDSRRDFLHAAERGYRFLRDRLFDSKSGGYFWRADRAGRLRDDRKILYGQSFVILALTEYFRASGDGSALAAAEDLFALVQGRARGPAGFHVEHFRRDWEPIPASSRAFKPPKPGWLSANFAVHWMEALAELAAESGRSGVREALAETIETGGRFFFAPGMSVRPAYRRADGAPLVARPGPWNLINRIFPPLRGEARIVPVGPGYLVEHAWLRVRAERVLGRQPSWDAFDRNLDAALESAFDNNVGGLNEFFLPKARRRGADRVWWIQVELLAALTEAVAANRGPRFVFALDRQLDWLRSRQTDPATGIFWEVVRFDGTVAVASLAHNWKAGYHDLRALVKFVETFEPRA